MKLFYEDAAEKTRSILSKYDPKSVVVSYSGGSDSDTVLWFLRSLGYNPRSVFSNTGLEYDATKRHVEKMRSIGFDIVEVRPRLSIPMAVSRYGLPFISKRTSEAIDRLCGKGFDFRDGSLERLAREFPGCRSALRWWTNSFRCNRMNVAGRKYLKEFIAQNYSTFPTISNKCCHFTKIKPMERYHRENKIGLVITGVRRAEGGQRIRLNRCYMKKDLHDIFMPIFWWSKSEKMEFDDEMGIVHSDCYVEYGLERTGCAGCPYGNFEKELRAIGAYEPKLYKACWSIFGESYKLSRRYFALRDQCDLMDKDDCFLERAGAIPPTVSG